jgi:dienelactone hydrolase
MELRKDRPDTGVVPLIAGFGSWTSPISAESVAAGAIRLSAVTPDDSDLYWHEARPYEEGRGVVVKWNREAGVVDLTPPGTNVRTRVHEYGGAAFVLSHGALYYSEFADQRLYCLTPGVPPRALTPPAACWFADAIVDHRRARLVCVREDHRDGAREAETTLVSVALDGSQGAGRIIASGHDFYSTPRISPDGGWLSWLTWDHPRMPWDGTDLWVAAIRKDGTLDSPTRIAGGATESIFQPGWSPDGTLYFASDRTGWWNLYRAPAGHEELVFRMPADFGRPQWQFGMSTWAFSSSARILLSFQERGRWRLGTFDLTTGTFNRIDTELEPGDNIAASATHAFFVGGSIAAPECVVRVDLETGAVERIRAAADVIVDPDFVSAPDPIEFPTEGGVAAHAFYYSPRNRDYAPHPGERPPLIVINHGGPTASTSARLNLEVQFWTSRGFAIVDVNYGGSSGYGRAYRRRLLGEWGITDVADCVNAASYLVTQGLADADRLIVRGRSAGGYTTLAALTFRPEVFAAGASYYGVSDLETLAADTHKFERHYLDSLVGPYPQHQATYRARSPIHFVDQLACPIVFFQGTEDRVVPPSQSQLMAAAMRRKGLRVELRLFPGEQHGFRRRDTIVQCLESELAFYREVLRM